MALRLSGPLGAISFQDRHIFEDKMISRIRLPFDGVKHGIAWKVKVER